MRATAIRLAMGTILIGLIWGWAGNNPAYAQKKVPEGAKILLLSGGQRQHHGYRDQAFFLSRMLEDAGVGEVTIVEDGAFLLSPKLANYQILIAVADRRDPEFKFTLPQQEAILAFVKNGGGYISLHAADNAAPDWTDGWRDMLGGVFSHVGLPDSKVRKGLYQVRVTPTKHPVTDGIADFELQDELYYHLQMRDHVEPLLTVKHDNQDWPVAWVRTYGKGKVFHYVLGHRDFGPDKPDPLQHPQVTRLVTQAVRWVAPARVAAQPTAKP